MSTSRSLSRTGGWHGRFFFGARDERRAEKRTEAQERQAAYDRAGRPPASAYYRELQERGERPEVQ